MIYHVNAPPGNGKSAFLMYILELELISTERQILTNLQINIPGLVAYLIKKYPNIDVVRRVCLLTFEQALIWWRMRGMDEHGNMIEWLPTREYVRQIDVGPSATKEMISWPVANDAGVCYLLDEWQEFYSQFDSLKFSREHVSAISQHRKFRVDAYFCCPYLEQLAKPYREIGQGFYQIKNMGYTSKGYGRAQVRLGTHFLWSLYLTPPSERSKPMLSGNFFLQPEGIHAYYNTAAGVGVQNKLADQGLKRSGISWKWAAAAILVAMAVVLFGGWKLFQRGRKGINLSNLAQSMTSPTALHAAEVPKVAEGITIDSIVEGGITIELPSTAGGVSAPTMAADNRQVAAPSAMPIVKPVQSPIREKIVWFAKLNGDIIFGLENGEQLVNPDGWFTGRELMLKGGAVHEYKPTFRKRSLVSKPSQP